MIDFNKVNISAQSSSTHPRDLFMTLPSKDEKYTYLHDVQADVLNKWFNRRNEKNTILKMNTGSGKTLVGLLILQSCIKENRGKSVYVVPDNYLISQVCSEAKELGIQVTPDENNPSFLRGNAILVTNVYKVFNGKSVFGISKNIPIENIVIDDVHACLDTINRQFSISIPSDHDAYKSVIKLIAGQIRSYDKGLYLDIIEKGRSGYNMQVPFWIWDENYQEIRQVFMDKHSEEDYVKFNLPLIEDVFNLCDCYLSSSNLEIVPRATPISKVADFENARRRIFMSATLADDSIFVSTMGLKLSKDSSDVIITPEKADDIGERLILFPQCLNHAIEDIDIKAQVEELSKSHNVVVIVPSFKRAEFWKNVATRTLSLTEGNIVEGVAQLKTGTTGGITVLVNKYDGIDLPNDSCRVLVIDGLPALQSESDEIIRDINPNDRQLLRRRIEKIEQGMGRGVRSVNDYCVVILMSNSLVNTITTHNGDKYFSSATRKQYQLAEQIWDQIAKSNNALEADTILSHSELLLGRDEEWKKANKQALSEVSYDKKLNLDPIVVALRNAFDMACASRFDTAKEIIEECKSEASDKETKGYLGLVLATYVHQVDPSQAQKILLSAKKNNLKIATPKAGIQLSKECDQEAFAQARSLISYLQSNNVSNNSYIEKMDRALSNLVFSEEGSAKKFEESLKEIASLIGIKSSRPDNEKGGRPDNLWRIKDGLYLVIECKNEAVVDAISKDYCDKLLGYIEWFKQEYGTESNFIPTLVHKSNLLTDSAHLPEGARIMTPEKISEFKQSLMSFAKSVTSNEAFMDPSETSKLLKTYGLLGNNIIQGFTVGWSKSKSKS